ncbi:hypothetical protein CU669_11585 [Paramagnetospirillum kuznetsovii]|uniref:histidine kinase n=1 Tax=Paramagnetospirillum kuznetsovii TaxID=2053833 RepID=A0A364NXX2_9PROT|nr:ATP-binding protein [Paramagnetospirillum kuznetsovii]RAU21929.1 hypothetical protein CU669_11585 [Paramagnetospirillum kuznetsovii]
MIETTSLHRQSIRWRWVLCTLALVAMGAMITPVHADDHPPLNILYISPYARDLPSQIATEDGLDRVLGYRSGGRNNVFIEYLDTIRLPLADSEAALAGFIATKYARVHLDAVISSGWTAASFISRNASKFSGARRIYADVSSLDLDTLRQNDAVAEVVLGQSDFGKSLGEALALSGATRVYVVGESTSPTGKIRLAAFRKAVADLPSSTSVEYLLDLKLTDLLERSATLPKGAMIYYLLTFGDGEGRVMRPYDVVSQLSQRASAPIFSQWESLMGSGIVGGYMLSAESVGRSIGAVVLGGVPDINNSFVHVYDWRQIERWRLQANALPTDGIIQFRQPGIFDLYPRQISGIAVAIVSLVGLLIFLARVLMERNLALAAGLEDRAKLAALTDDLNSRIAERTQDLFRTRHIQAFAAEVSRGFLVSTQPDDAFARLVSGIIRITNSEFAFLGHALFDGEGEPYLLTRAISNSAGDAETRALLASQPTRMEFHNLDTLFGHTLKTGEAVFSDNPETDPRSGGLPPGHPPLRNYMGVPLYFEDTMVGMVGIANRDGGFSQQLANEMEAVWAAAAGILHAARKDEDRKRVDAKIRILSRAVEASPSLIIITDREGLIQYVNPRFSEVTGYELEESSGQTPSKLTFDDSCSDIYTKFLHALNLGQPWRGEVRNRKKDGTYYVADVSIAPISDDIGGISHFVIIQEDVTETLMAHEALAANEKRFRELVESAGSTFHFYSLAPDCSYLYASPNCVDWFGVDQESIVGKDWVDIARWSDESIGKMLRALQECQRGTIPTPVSLEFYLNGTSHHLISYPHPVKDTRGRVIKIEGLAVDVTERTKLERRLQVAVVEAESANQAKSDFLSSMSHELRTPLNAILGFAQMLDYSPKEPLSVSQKKCVDRILKGGQHLLEIINDILDLAKIESGRIDLHMEDIAFGDLVEECRSFVLPLAERQGIAIHIASFTDLTVRADYTRLKQVLFNLISNAIKYNRPNGRVDISCEPQSDSKVVVVVTDTGIGIPEREKSEIFQPFSRLGQESSGIEGTGIGLTITKRLVEAMNGSLDFTSTVGEGSVFRVTMPTSATASHSKDLLPAISRMPLDEIRGRALYVEDNPANIELMEMVFSRLPNVGLLTALCGERGLRLARITKPDLIILDINLPGMGGYEILQRLRDMDETKSTPVFAVTAAATQLDIERGCNAGFDKYMTKPYAIEALIDALREVFHGDSSK